MVTDLVFALRSATRRTASLRIASHRIATILLERPKMFRTNPETAIIIDRIADLLRAISIDQLLTYAEIDQCAGINSRDRFRYLCRARDRVEAETGLRFETVYRLGIKKISGAAVAGIGATARKKIRRHAARAAKRLTGLRYNDLDSLTQNQIDRERSMLSLIHFAASSKAEKSVIIDNGPQPTANILKQLLNHGGSDASFTHPNQISPQ